MNNAVLGNYIDTLKGFAFKSGWFEEKGTPVVKVTNFTDDSVSMERVDRVSDDIARKYQRYVLLKDDVVVQTVGSWPSNPASVVGKVIKIPAQANKALLNQNAVIIKPNEKLNKSYLFYLLKTDSFKSYIVGTARGAASQASITLDAIKNFKFLCPAIEEQVKVAEILNSYDDLIENNTRRIAILETMAQNLYREWFVNFRFPGHEQSQWQDSPQGKIPAGWVVKKLYEIATVNSESITNKNAPEIIYYVDISSVNTGSIEEIKPMNFKEAPSRARRIVRHGDIIWATVRPNRKQFSYIANPVENTIVSTGFAVLRAEKVPASFLYQATTTDSFTAYLVNHATGAAYPAVNATVFENAEILVPDKDLLEKFDDLVAITMKQIEVLKKKNKNLKQQRDMLLSKLIGG